jgi:DNA-binding CsgD family transcriptional regulator
MLEPPGSPLILPGRTGQPLGFGRHLSRLDALHCLEIIQRSLACTDRNGLSALLAEAGGLIEADYCACMLNSRRPAPDTNRMFVVAGTYPLEWVTLYMQRRFHQVDPIAAENFQNYALQSWAETYRKSPPPRYFLSLAEDFGLKTGYTYGQRDPAGTGGSLFSFAGPNMQTHPRSAQIQNLLLPHLHRVLCNLEPPQPAPVQAVPLSGRELEVLKWISAGKSSWETGVILRISERTVNFHIRNIVQKLDAVNRPQAVAMALQLGLLELP